MKSKPCLLIPNYDHGRELVAVIEALAEHGLPCLVVDDGSGKATRDTLETLAQRHSFLDVHYRDRNGGRGAALKSGYRLAAARGYTHVIQLDADGQHCVADVPRFVDAIDRNPGALVLGAPVFDDSAPKARLYGRQLSRVTVWAATFSFAVADPLCGFRGIPLGPMLAVLDSERTGDHMEFDPEIVIQLVQRGTPVVNLPTQVVYNEGGLSHFDMLGDNVRLIGIYFKALYAMPMRVLTRRRSVE
jgi:glycosyltransferase involved in cell wall biosynthesis